MDLGESEVATDSVRPLSVCLWLDSASIADVAVQVDGIRRLSGDISIVVVGEESCRGNAPIGVQFLSVEQVFDGNVHPTAVEPDDRFTMAMVLLAASGSGELMLFLRPSIRVVDRLDRLTTRLGDGDGLVFVERWPLSATARFSRVARAARTRGLVDDALLVRCGSAPFRTMADEILGAFGSIVDSSLAAVVVQVLAGLLEEPSGGFVASYVDYSGWASFCRGRSGDDVDSPVSLVHSGSLDQYFSDRLEAAASKRASGRRVADHDDFFLAHRVHGIDALQGLVDRRLEVLGAIPISVRDEAERRYCMEFARIRRALDPFGNRWTDSDGADFAEWLSERSASGETRLAELLSIAHPDRRWAIERLRRDPLNAAAWAVLGIDPERPSFVPSGTSEAMSGGHDATLQAGDSATGATRGRWAENYLRPRIDARVVAMRPHLVIARQHAKAAAVHALPVPIRGGAQRLKGKVDGASAAQETPVAGRFGDRQLRGLNVIGPYRNLSGLSVAMQASLDALTDANVAFDLWDTSDFLPTKTTPPESRIPFQSTGDVNLFHLNINEIIPKLALDLRYVIGGHYNIGYWFWETLTMPAGYLRACRLLSEAWCATRFIAEAIGAHGVRTEVIGMPYRLPSASDIAPHELPLDPDRFTVVFAFDCYSSIARKNPLGLIEAFSRAFGRDRDVQLVLKANNLIKFPRFEERLRSLAAASGNLVVHGAAMPRNQLNGLIAGADLYASLHRSEGVGLTLLEAMALGTPCMGTAYSGNLDFMSEENSLLVPGQLTTSAEQEGPYPPGTVWFDPDLDVAADMLRSARDNRAERTTRSAAAVLSAQQFCDPRRYAERFLAGLDRLGIAT